jgi:hypothetical protein
MLSGHCSSGKSASPCTGATNEPRARKLSIPGTWIGLSSRRAATFGCPIIVIAAFGPLSNRPSIAASATG